MCIGDFARSLAGGMANLMPSIIPLMIRNMQD